MATLPIAVDDPAAVKAEALDAMRRDDFRRAANLLRRIADDSDDIEVLNNLAVALVAQGRAADARWFLGQAELREVEGQSSSVVRHNVRALERLTAGDLDDGLRSIGTENQAAVMIAPTGQVVFTASDDWSPSLLSSRSHIIPGAMVGLVTLAACVLFRLPAYVLLLTIALYIRLAMPDSRAASLMALPRSAGVRIRATTNINTGEGIDS